jgi:hypothetical protein
MSYRNAINIRYRATRSLPVTIFTSNILHQLFSKFGLGEIARLGFAPMTVLTHHIISIFFGSSQKQMVGIDTRWIIAFVANKHPLWNRAISKFPGVAMGHNFFTATGEFPVAPLSSTSGKKPTSISLLNPRPKPLFKGFLFGIVITSPVTITATTLFYIAKRCGKTLAAELANTVYLFGFSGIIHSVKPSFQGVTNPRLLVQRGAFCC